jgi:hypothetical protein
MLTIGAALSFILIGRLIFSIFIMLLLINIINFIPKSIFNRSFFRKI